MIAQWYAALFAWFLMGLLVMNGFIFWGAIAAITGVALVVSIAITGGIARAVRAWRRDAKVIDDAFAEINARILISLTCSWCNDLDSPGDPRDCRCAAPCKSIDWCNAGGRATSLIDAVKEDGPATLTTTSDIPEGNPS